MHTFHNPKKIAGPFGHYDHGVETALPGRLLHVSGQIGIAVDGPGVEITTIRDPVAIAIFHYSLGNGTGVRH